jgi:hypothetical protein
MQISRWMLITSLAFVAVESAAQDALGRWNVNFDSDLGPVAYSLEFALNGEGNLTGSMINEFGSTPIEDGVLNGNDISYKLTLDFGQGPTTFVFKGTVEGDVIEITSTFEEPPPGFESAAQSFTATRAE